MALRELPADDQPLDPLTVLAAVLLGAIMAIGVTFAVLVMAIR